MKYYIGLDVGTSSTKALLTSRDGIIRTASRDYPVSYPQPGWSEQDPADWWNAALECIAELLEGVDATLVAGIGAGGQMHGLVALDAQDNVIRPAILWNDGRTSEEVAYLNDTVGRERLSRYTANIAFAGFTAPKLLWLRRHEPENFARIDKLMLPKDYVNYRLTGVHCCDYSDASGTLLLDVAHRRWSSEMLDICGVDERWLPKLFESYERVGFVRREVAEALGLPEGVAVCAGAGDNAAAAVGTGVVGDGGCNISLGTSGTLFVSSSRFSADPNNALHSFAHADGGWHLMGCMLSAASCNKWFCEEILRRTSAFSAESADISGSSLGRNRVFFLPYLMGERSPVNDSDARGVFIGMSMDTSRADMLQAVYEGVAFAMRDSLEVARSLGIAIPRSMICGGGSRSPLWTGIMASVLGIPLDIPLTEQGPGYGGALLAMVACGEFDTVADAAKAMTGVRSTVEPEPELTALYNDRYNRFREIYPACRELFQKLK